MNPEEHMPDKSRKLRIAILYGGRSSEHDVSILSASNVIQALDPSRYEPVPVFVTRDGRWLLGSWAGGILGTPATGTEICLLSGGTGRAIGIPETGAPFESTRLDLLFPVLHGLHGEDGSVQGLAAVAGLPLVGCGILGSAIALDKDVAKRLLREAGLPVAQSVTIHEASAPSLAFLEARLGLPFFLKPARQGSSVGVRRVSASQEFPAALAEGFAHDDKLIAEAFVEGREVELSVLENPDGSLFVSLPGEIAPAESHGFYSYAAKYVDENGAALMVPADLPTEVESALRNAAARAFRAVGCDGMARVDFFLRPDMSFVVNELNTIPGFTDISMYAKAMAASGVRYPEIIDRLVAHALARAGRGG